MYRQVMSLILVPCVLLTQSVAFGHSHGGREPAGHGLRPHFHTKLGSAGHHHHPGDTDAPEPGTPAAEPISDHDADAVYLDVVSVVITDRLTANDHEPTAAFDAVVGSASCYCPGVVTPGLSVP